MEGTGSRGTRDEPEREARPAASPWAGPAPTPDVGPGCTGRGAGDDADVAAGPARAVVGEDGDRREIRRTEEGRPVLEVRGLTPAGRAAVREELHLLASLEVDAIRAAPDVLEVLEDGYVRECPPPLRHRAGHRAAPAATPPTGERLARSRAREDLDAFCAALHARGWVLGAVPGSGLSVREDGGVCVGDLRGLRREDALREQVEDRAWVDSVLLDGDRTLRRRVDGAPDGAGDLEVDGAVDDAVEGRGDGAPVALMRADLASGTGAATGAVSPWPGMPRTAGSGGPRRRAADARRHARRGDRSRRSRRGRPGGRALAGAAFALLLIGGGIALFPLPGPAGDGRDPEPGGPATVTDLSAPSIPDPTALAAQLAADRHAYVTGTSGTPVSGAETPARAEDDAVRRAYSGAQVEGGEPRVRTAELLAAPDPDGAARLRVELETPAHAVLRSDGTREEVEATGPVTVLLDLRWDGSTWLVESTTAA